MTVPLWGAMAAGVGTHRAGTQGAALCKICNTKVGRRQAKIFVSTLVHAIHHALHAVERPRDFVRGLLQRIGIVGGFDSGGGEIQAGAH